MMPVGYFSGQSPTKILVEIPFPLGPFRPPKDTPLSLILAPILTALTCKQRPVSSCCSSITNHSISCWDLFCSQDLSFPGVVCSQNHSHLLLVVLFYSPSGLNFLFSRRSIYSPFLVSPHSFWTKCITPILPIQLQLFKVYLLSHF